MEAVTTTTSNEGVLVVLQTENGEQIALPMSALPSDFVPGDSEQLIMVESSLDEQHQEVVVESSDITTTAVNTHTEPHNQRQSNTESLVTLHDETSNLHHHQLAPADPITSASVAEQSNSATTTATIIAEDQFKASNSNNLSLHDAPMIQLQPLTDSPSKALPRTYGRTYGNNIKSYAPTCGVTRIYQQVTPTQQSSREDEEITPKTEEMIIITQDLQATTTVTTTATTPTATTATTIATIPDLNESPSISSNGTATTSQSESIPVEAPPQTKKQKRKEPLLTKPLNEEDMELKFHIMEEPMYGVSASPEVQKERKRKEYKTKKKIKLAMEKLASEKLVTDQPETEDLGEDSPTKEKQVTEKAKEKPVTEKAKERLVTEKVREKKVAEKIKEKAVTEKEKPVTEKAKEKLVCEKPTKNILTVEKPSKEKRIKAEKDSPQVERRTRLSNSCRVATGKSYKCNDCEYSTERINNIILHIKEKHVSHK